jgi:hypothetical protein
MCLKYEDPCVIQDGTFERTVRKRKVGYEGWLRGAVLDYLGKMMSSCSRRQGTVGWELSP